MLFTPHTSKACHPSPLRGVDQIPAVACVFGILLSCGSTNAAFAAHDSLTEADLLSDIPVISLATGMDQALNRSPASITIIDQQMIADSGALNWVDVFRLVPGFQAYAVNANRFAISYHGVGQEFPNQLEVMVDGRSVYEPIQSTVIWSSLGIDLDDIERIEIVRGPNAPTQGSNAFLGAVNIITRAPLQDAGTRLKVVTGDNRTREVALRHNNKLGAADYRLSVNYRHNNGFPDIDAFGPDDGEEALSFALRTTLTPNLNNSLDVDVGFSRQDTEFGYPSSTDEFIPVRYYSQYQRLHWDHLISDKQDFQLQFYRNYFRAYGTTNLGLLSTLVPGFLFEPPFNLVDQPFIFGFHTMESERYDLEGRYRHQFSDRLKWTVGLGARHESVDATLFLSDKGKVDEQSFRLFSHSEWSPWQRLTFNAGVMIENSIEGTLISPRLSLNYDLHPDHTLRLSGARGKRTPSITETNERLTYRTGNLILEDQRRTEELDEEQITNIELAYLARLPDHNMTLDFKLFWEEVDDGLEDYEESFNDFPANLDTNRLVRDNIATWETRGAEMELTYRPGDQTYIRLHYTYLDLDSELIETLAPLTFTDINDSMPRHAGGLLVNHRLNDAFSAGVTLYHQSEVEWLSGAFIDEFTRIDAQITYRFKVGSSSGKLQLIGQNLGEDYKEFFEENVFETRVLLKATLDFP